MSSRLAVALYEFSYWVFSFGYVLLFSLRTAGRRNMPQSGPVLLIANHESFLDPMIVGSAARRHIHYLARKTLFRSPALGWFLNAVNTVPIDQDGVGKDGIREILSRLNEGHAVLVFPEGERCPDGKFHSLRPGVALLLSRVHVPIVPVGIVGAFEAWPRHQTLPRLSPLFMSGSPRSLAVAVGPPRDPATLKGMSREQMLTTLHDDIARQIEVARRAQRRPW